MRKYLQFVSVIFVLLCLQLVLRADVVHLKSGGRIRGRVIRKTEDQVQIQTKYGLQKFDMKDVKEIEYEKSVEETYEEKRAGLGAHDSEGHYELGLWCREKGRKADAEREFREVLRIDSEHAGARIELGYAKYAGRWIPPSGIQKYLDRGLVVYKGRLMTPEEKKRLEASAPPEEDPKPVEKEPKRETGPEEKETGREEKYVEKHLPWDKAKTTTVSNYRIKSNVDPKVLKKYKKLIGSLYGEFRKVMKGDLKEKGKLDVYIYARRGEYEQEEKKDGANGGVYDPEVKRVAVYHGFKLGRQTTESVIVRECARQFEDLIFINIYMAPVWLTEGIIAYFEASSVSKKGRFHVGPPPPRDFVTNIRDMASKGKHTSLKKLIRLQRYRFIPSKDGSWANEHLLAWSLVYFMIHSRGGTRKTFNEFVDFCARKRSRPEHFERMVGDMGTLEDKWKEFFRKVKLSLPGEVDGDVFTSGELGLVMEKPKDWKFSNEGEGAGFQVRITDGKSCADLFMYGNKMKYTTDSFGRQRKRVLEETFSRLVKTDAEFGGVKAVKFTYSDSDRRKGMPPAKEDCDYVHFECTRGDYLFEFIVRTPLDETGKQKENVALIIDKFKFTEKAE